ncbi:MULTISPECIES: AAA family ATPase [Leptolyngbya]|uniref:AAA family ATPase n=1 Tax=Leptolyngbya TaxID=47251 RepID=UPI001688905B|nr:AAA family ATPase [Leptolyngbya sp. FACHB-1624]MBD1855768.1 AAA family ATPase [Leptolyngbya sp. FACHB-1624]
MTQAPRPGSWKAKLNRSTENSFIGRELQLQAFRGVLSTPYDDRTTSIFSISGQGGIGKTTLLKQFRRITTELGQVAAYVDEGSQTNLVDNVPEALSRLALDLEKQGIECKKFQERYKVYRQKKQELEADPDAPQGFAAGMGKFIARAGIGVAKSIPGSGGVMEFVDSEGVANQAGEWTAFVARKLTNKDEVRLVQEPIEVLTPLFLEDLNRVAEKQTIVLLLDTYEQTGAFLDDWLRSLLNDRYDVSLHPNCLICIAGRDPLNKNAWIGWEKLIARSELEPFTKAEARLYLASCAITQESIVQEIWRLSSGGLPVLIAMMAQGAPREVEQISDPCEDAVERFLWWEQDEKKRKIAQNAALPRLINQDVLAVLTSDAEADSLFDWLKSRSFVVQHPNGWQYHNLVRGLILRYQHKVSLKSWAALHEKLANYYDEMRQGLKLEESQRWKDETWQQYSLEWLYHTLCMAPQRSLGIALNGWLVALNQEHQLAQEWATVMATVGEITNYEKLRGWGSKLQISEDDNTELEKVLSSLLKENCLEDKARAIALTQQVFLALKQSFPALTSSASPDDIQPMEFGECLRNITDVHHMIETLNQALNLAPNAADSLFLRSFLHMLEGNLSEAETDFTLAMDVAKDSEEELQSIQNEYLQMIKILREESNSSSETIGLLEFIHKQESEIQQKEKEIQRLRSEQQLRSEIRRLRSELFRVFWAKKNYEKAYDIVSELIADKPNGYWTLCLVAEAFLFSKEVNPSIRALNRALQVNSQDSRVYYNFALLHLIRHELDSFKANITLAIQIAQTCYSHAPDDWRNVLELALYRLVDEQVDAAELLFRQVVNGRVPSTRIRVAICDLQILLTLFPDFNLAQQMIELLKTSIEQ